MKTLRSLLIGVLALLVGLFFIRHSLNKHTAAAGDKIIYFYNWGDYIDPSILKDFEAETGYKVIYETFDSNEGMITKVERGGTPYDIVVPSDYIVEIMRSHDFLIPLDYSLLPNAVNMNPIAMGLPFDPENEYSLPYFWGTLGIIYNTEVYGDDAFHDWNELWKPEYAGQILMIDGAREVLGIGLQSSGHSVNETDDDILQQAANKMKRLQPNIAGYITDEMKMHLANEERYIGVTFSGEAMSAMEHLDSLKYIVPRSGSNLWADNLVIPKTSKNIKGAHALIDYLCRPEIAARNTEYIGYTTPVLPALDLVDPEMFENEAFNPPAEIMDKLEFYRDLGKERIIHYNDLFLEIKIAPKK